MTGNEPDILPGRDRDNDRGGRIVSDKAEVVSRRGVAPLWSDMTAAHECGANAQTRRNAPMRFDIAFQEHAVVSGCMLEYDLLSAAGA